MKKHLAIISLLTIGVMSRLEGMDSTSSDYPFIEKIFIEKSGASIKKLYYIFQNDTQFFFDGGKDRLIPSKKKYTTIRKSKNKYEKGSYVYRSKDPSVDHEKILSRAMSELLKKEDLFKKVMNSRIKMHSHPLNTRFSH